VTASRNFPSTPSDAMALFRTLAVALVATSTASATCGYIAGAQFAYSATNTLSAVCDDQVTEPCFKTAGQNNTNASQAKINGACYQAIKTVNQSDCVSYALAAMKTGGLGKFTKMFIAASNCDKSAINAATADATSMYTKANASAGSKSCMQTKMGITTWNKTSSSCGMNKPESQMKMTSTNVIACSQACVDTMNAMVKYCQNSTLSTNNIVAGVNGAIVTSLQSVVSQRKASCATLAANIKAGMAGMAQGTQWSQNPANKAKMAEIMKQGNASVGKATAAATAIGKTATSANASATADINNLVKQLTKDAASGNSQAAIATVNKAVSNATAAGATHIKQAAGDTAALAKAATALANLGKTTAAQATPSVASKVNTVANNVNGALSGAATGQNDQAVKKALNNFNAGMNTVATGVKAGATTAALAAQLENFTEIGCTSQDGCDPQPLLTLSSKQVTYLKAHKDLASKVAQMSYVLAVNKTQKATWTKTYAAVGVASSAPTDASMAANVAVAKKGVDSAAASAGVAVPSAKVAVQNAAFTAQAVEFSAINPNNATAVAAFTKANPTFHAEKAKMQAVAEKKVNAATTQAKTQALAAAKRLVTTSAPTPTPKKKGGGGNAVVIVIVVVIVMIVVGVAGFMLLGGKKEKVGQGGESLYAQQSAGQS